MSGSPSRAGGAVDRRGYCWSSSGRCRLLRRALSDERIDAVGARELTALFREARYSTHRMDDSQVCRARTALDAIATRLAGAAPWATTAAHAGGGQAGGGHRRAPRRPGVTGPWTRRTAKSPGRARCATA
ncbi:hypothetical protein ACIPLC_11540 [Kitasatospora sp. NPDC086801]|uniref:hypothetical protein n=1 Tax=Kitasatospora sp. NPDC086801 TaxID=3364066 RepID=UPI00381C06B5